MISTIIHPTDFSEATVPALKMAQDLAQKLSVRLLVCYIARPPQVASGTTLTDPNTKESHDVAAELESLLPAHPAVNRELRIVLADQSAGVKKLLSYLDSSSDDLIVLGMHHKTGIAGWFGGSITEEVVRNAQCNVLVVKQGGSEATDDADS